MKPRPASLSCAALLAALVAVIPVTAAAGDAPGAATVGMLVPAALGVTRMAELDGATICYPYETQTELMVAEYFETNGMMYAPLVYADEREALTGYEQGNCDVFAGIAGTLDIARQMMAMPGEHMILPETLPQGAATK